MSETGSTAGGGVFAVIGHPIAHSKSPQIHHAFGRQLGIELSYERLPSAEPDFEGTVAQFVSAGGRGLNVTLPFKERALRLADQASDRARLAGAANTLSFFAGSVSADNTDGIGLVTDLTGRWGQTLQDAEVILLGAGGAARGVLLPLLQAGISSLTIANRSADKAVALAAMICERPEAASISIRAVPFESLADWPAPGGDAPDRLIINATASGLHAERLALSPAMFAGAALAYDMVYASAATVFMQQALEGGCRKAVDGLGMLVEQAAESFLIWHGQRPLTDPVYKLLRQA